MCTSEYVRIPAGEPVKVGHGDGSSHYIGWDCLECTTAVQGYVIGDGAKCEDSFFFDDAKYDIGVHVKELAILPGHWRSSNSSQLVRPCKLDEGKDIVTTHTESKLTERGTEHCKSDDPEDCVKLACVGGSSMNVTSYCNEGHFGPLCALCEKRWNFDPAASACVPCEGENVYGVLAIIVGVVVALGLCIIGVVLHAQSHSAGGVATTKAGKLMQDIDAAGRRLSISASRLIDDLEDKGNFDVVDTAVEEIEHDLEKKADDQAEEVAESNDDQAPEISAISEDQSRPARRKSEHDHARKVDDHVDRVSYAKACCIGAYKAGQRSSNRLKTMISLYQLLSSCPFVLNIQFPVQFVAIVNDIGGLVNLNVLTILSIECVTDVNYFTYLVTYTMGPLVALATIALISGCISQASGKDSHALSRGMGLCLLIVHFVFPGASLAAFFALKCDSDFDPENTVSYMSRDYSIECTDESGALTTEYQGIMIYTWVVIIIFPIGGLQVIFNQPPVLTLWWIGRYPAHACRTTLQQPGRA